MTLSEQSLSSKIWTKKLNLKSLVSLVQARSLSLSTSLKDDLAFIEPFRKFNHMACSLPLPIQNMVKVDSSIFNI